MVEKTEGLAADTKSSTPRVRSPWLRLIIAISTVLIPFILMAVVKEILREVGLNDLLLIRILHMFVLLAFLLLSYRLYVHKIERRPLIELPLNKALLETGTGLIWGFVLMSTVIGVLALTGTYTVTGSNFELRVLKWPVIFIVSVFLEELLFRGILLRLLEEALGSILAILIGGILFGAMHFANEGATLFSSFGVAIEGGIMVGLLWTLTRRMWGVLGLHYAWNTVQGAFYGVPVSGVRQIGILDGNLQGPDLLTGSIFGVENSLVTVLLCLLFCVYLVRLNLRRSCFRPPPWKTQKIPVEVEEVTK